MPGTEEAFGSRPAVFLDRDGTVIREEKYLSDPEGVVLIPGAARALRSLQESGFALVVVTNQSGIARGLYSLAQYKAVARRLDELLAANGIRIDTTRFCPHHPEATGPCECRKPGTGMHRSAAQALGLDPTQSWYIGDRTRDVLPAEELGGRGILVRTGYGAGEEADLPEGFHVAEDLAAAADRILGTYLDPSKGPK